MHITLCCNLDFKNVTLNIYMSTVTRAYAYCDDIGMHI